MDVVVGPPVVLWWLLGDPPAMTRACSREICSTASPGELNSKASFLVSSGSERCWSSTLAFHSCHGDSHPADANVIDKFGVSQMARSNRNQRGIVSEKLPKCVIELTGLTPAICSLRKTTANLIVTRYGVPSAGVAAATRNMGA